MFEKIAAMIADQLGIDASTIQPESRLIEDLKADSLDVVAMVMEMETEFGIEIPDEDLTKLNDRRRRHALQSRKIRSKSSASFAYAPGEHGFVSVR